MSAGAECPMPESPDGGASLQGEAALVAAAAHPKVLVGGEGGDFVAQTLSTAPAVDEAIRKAGGRPPGTTQAASLRALGFCVCFCEWTSCGFV